MQAGSCSADMGTCGLTCEDALILPTSAAALGVSCHAGFGIWTGHMPVLGWWDQRVTTCTLM